MPFVLFALFPSTSARHVLKKNAELYDVNAVPFLIGARHLRALRAALEGHALLELVREQPGRQPGRGTRSPWSSACSPLPAARLSFPGGDSSVAIFITYLVPPTLLFLPLSTVVARLASRTACGRSS